LRELNAALPALKELGVDVIAVSTDSKARAMAHMAEVLPEFDVA
jgi:alkyl hydroperoxide reductase subunit AhpC